MEIKKTEVAEQLHTAEELKQQTEKMLRDIKEKRKQVTLVNPEKNHLIENIDAYISDTSHFLEKKDFILAFEAVVWAWSILELGLELNIFRMQ